MSTMVAVGEELMPHREIKVASSTCDFASEQVSQDSQTTSIRKLSRKQGLVIQEETVVEDSSDIEGDNEDSKKWSNTLEMQARETHL